MSHTPLEILVDTLELMVPPSTAIKEVISPPANNIVVLGTPSLLMSTTTYLTLSHFSSAEPPNPQPKQDEQECKD